MKSLNGMSKKKEERDQKSKLWIFFQKIDWQIYDDKAL